MRPFGGTYPSIENWESYGDILCDPSFDDVENYLNGGYDTLPSLEWFGGIQIERWDNKKFLEFIDRIDHNREAEHSFSDFTTVLRQFRPTKNNVDRQVCITILGWPVS